MSMLIPRKTPLRDPKSTFTWPEVQLNLHFIEKRFTSTFTWPPKSSINLHFTPKWTFTFTSNANWWTKAKWRQKKHSLQWSEPLKNLHFSKWTFPNPHFSEVNLWKISTSVSEPFQNIHFSKSTFPKPLLH